jgi:hypothetical protein
MSVSPIEIVEIYNRSWAQPSIGYQAHTAQIFSCPSALFSCRNFASTLSTPAAEPSLALSCVASLTHCHRPRHQRRTRYGAACSEGRHGMTGVVEPLALWFFDAGVGSNRFPGRESGRRRRWCTAVRCERQQRHADASGGGGAAEALTWRWRRQKCCMAAASWGGERKGRTTLRDRKKGTQWLREAVLIARTDTIIWTTWSVLEVENPTEF